MTASALRELEAAASLGAAVFLALHDARIAREEATLLQHWTQIRLIGDERFRDAVAHRACLPRQAAAHHRADGVELSIASGNHQGLAKDHAQHGPSKIDLLFLAVDDDAPRPRLQPNPCYGVLAFARRIGAALAIQLGAAFGRGLRLIGLLRLDQSRLQIGKIANSLGHVSLPSLCGSWCSSGS